VLLTTRNPVSPVRKSPLPPRRKLLTLFRVIRVLPKVRRIPSSDVPLAYEQQKSERTSTYFEMRLAEARQKVTAKEPYLPKFSAGFTTEKLKRWNEVIALIQERIASIKGMPYCGYNYSSLKI
jgi:hypothetical protein